jgi:hypothetical protein
METESRITKGEPVQVSAALTKQDIKALSVNRNYQPTDYGISFATKKDAEGKDVIVSVPQSEMDDLGVAVQHAATFRDWALGDFMLAYEAMFGKDALQAKIAEFTADGSVSAETIKKLMSAGRSFGWPNQERMAEQREIRKSIQFHYEVMGMNKTPEDLVKRRQLLQTAADNNLSVMDLKLLVKQHKAGPGACLHPTLSLGYGKCPDPPDGCGETVSREYGVFKIPAHAFDPKTESEELFAQSIVNDLAAVDADGHLIPSQKLKDEIKMYLDPALRAQAEALEKKRDMADKIEDPTIKAEFLAKIDEYDDEGWEKAIGEHVAKASLTSKKTAHALKHFHVKPVGDAKPTEITEQGKKLLEEGANDDLDAFKKRVTDFKTANKENAKAEEEICTLADKITDESLLPQKEAFLGKVHSGELSTKASDGTTKDKEGNLISPAKVAFIEIYRQQLIIEQKAKATKTAEEHVAELEKKGTIDEKALAVVGHKPKREAKAADGEMAHPKGGDAKKKGAAKAKKSAKAK